MNGEERARWIEAARALGADPSAKVSCPEREDAILVVEDVYPPSGEGFERYLRCPVCKAYTAMRMAPRGATSRRDRRLSSGSSIMETKELSWRKFAPIDREYPIFELLEGAVILLDLTLDESGDVEVTFHDGILGRTLSLKALAAAIEEGKNALLEDVG